MWKGNPHRDHPLKIAAQIVLAIVLLMLLLVGVLGVGGTWNPFGISALFKRYPITMASVVFGISAAIFVYDYRSMPINIYTGRRRLPPVSTWWLSGSAVVLVCVLIGAHGI